ncbi:uncharacterized [Tachysurus ichikawai]
MVLLFTIVANYLLPLQGLSKSPTVITLCQVRDGVTGNHGNHRQPCRSKKEDERMIKRCPFEQSLLRPNKGLDKELKVSVLSQELMWTERDEM